MKKVIFGLSGLIFLGLVAGVQGNVVLREEQIPKAKVLPGHPFYPVKQILQHAKTEDHRLRDRLSELHGMLAEKRAATDLLDAIDAYAEEAGGASFEEAFYQTRALHHLAEKFPETKDDFAPLHDRLILAAANEAKKTQKIQSSTIAEFIKQPLAAIEFLDEVARRAREAEEKILLLSRQYAISSGIHGDYLAGKLRLGDIFAFLQSRNNLFSTLRVLDILRDTFPGGELGNQLQFFRQELLRSPRASESERTLLEEEIQMLEAGLEGAEKAKDATFNYDRALEFYSSGLYDRALAQASLSFSSLHLFLLDTFEEKESSRETIYAMRDDLQTLEKEFQKNNEKTPPQISALLKQAKDAVAEIFITSEQGAAPSFALLSRAKALLVALRELR